MKRCARCMQERPLEAFYRRSGAKDGRASYCRDCQRVYLQGWKRSNPEKVATLTRRDYERHRTARLTRKAAWRAAHPERQAELVARWAKEHPERRSAIHQRYHETHPTKRKEWQDQRRESGRRRIANMVRRGLVAAATLLGVPLTADHLFARFAVHGWRCYYCQTALTSQTVQADHRIPLKRGGLHCPANIVPACGACNRRKSSRTEREFWLVLHGSGRTSDGRPRDRLPATASRSIPD